MVFKINDRVKILSGQIGVITGLPTGFLSNGSYSILIGKETLWVKEEEILYSIDSEHYDDIDHYFEVIFDYNGINLIPKGVMDLNLEEGDEKKLTLNFNGDFKHKTLTLHLGDLEIKKQQNEK